MIVMRSQISLLYEMIKLVQYRIRHYCNQMSTISNSTCLSVSIAQQTLRNPLLDYNISTHTMRSPCRAFTLYLDQSENL